MCYVLRITSTFQFQCSLFRGCFFVVFILRACGDTLEILINSTMQPGKKQSILDKNNRAVESSSSLDKNPQENIAAFYMRPITYNTEHKLHQDQPQHEKTERKIIEHNSYLNLFQEMIHFVLFQVMICLTNQKVNPTSVQKDSAWRSITNLLYM